MCLLAAGCMTRTTTVERVSQSVIVEVRNSGLRYRGKDITKERLVKQIHEDEARNNPSVRTKNKELAKTLWKHVQLEEKEETPPGYLEELTAYFVKNRIPNVVIVRMKKAVAYETDKIPEPPSRLPTPQHTPANSSNQFIKR